MENGQTHIYWGNGKGKTSSALGLALRASSNNLNIHIIQFMKNPSQPSSELKFLEKFPNISFQIFGTDKFLSKETKAIHQEQTNQAFIHLQNSLKEDYDIIIADEILYALQFNLLNENQILSLIKSKPKDKELILTGAHIPFPNLFQAADLVTEIKKHKHPYDLGIKARKGIEY